MKGIILPVHYCKKWSANINTIYRWGDAPVHSIAVGLFLNKSEVHFFNDVGYKHYPFMHCPVARELQKKCHCNSEENFGKIPKNTLLS